MELHVIRCWDDSETGVSVHAFNENTLLTLADAGVFSAIGHYVIGTCCFENDV